MNNKNTNKPSIIFILFCLIFALVSFVPNNKEQLVRYDVEYYTEYNDKRINDRAAKGWVVVSSHASNYGFSLVWKKVTY